MKMVVWIRQFFCDHDFQVVGLISGWWVDRCCTKCDKQKIVDMGAWE